jgi:hypothetical protein
LLTPQAIQQLQIACVTGQPAVTAKLSFSEMMIKSICLAP